MKTEQKMEYICEICGSHFGTPDAAKLCETRPISEDKGVKVGDIVLITKGEGQGQQAKVTNRYIVTKDWGHYQWERYWHTVAVNADLIGSWGSRQLTFDSYEPLSLNNERSVAPASGA